jgi:hypothetical protein
MYGWCDAIDCFWSGSNLIVIAIDLSSDCGPMTFGPLGTSASEGGCFVRKHCPTLGTKVLLPALKASP